MTRYIVIDCACPLTRCIIDDDVNPCPLRLDLISVAIDLLHYHLDSVTIVPLHCHLINVATLWCHMDSNGVDLLYYHLPGVTANLLDY